MPRKPVIIADGLKDWPALGKWTPAFFKDNFPGKEVIVEGKAMRLGDFIDRVLASTPENPSPYLSKLLVRQQFPEIAPDILPDLAYTLPDRLRSRLMIGPVRGSGGIPELLIAGRGSRFRLHFDVLHMLGFVTQIYGNKEFIIFAPSDGRYLYPKKDSAHFSELDPFNPDLERFPLFDRATPCHFVLRAGETIFNPAGWWHATRMLTPSIAMVISTVNASNWQEFADDLGRQREGVPRPVTAALRAYLSVLGAFLTAQERLAARRVH
jgi:hypothetical protein